MVTRHKDARRTPAEDGRPCTGSRKKHLPKPFCVIPMEGRFEGQVMHEARTIEQALEWVDKQARWYVSLGLPIRKYLVKRQ